MKPYDAYLFDLDGTLLDSTDLIVETFRYSLKAVAGMEADPEIVRRHIGIPLKDQYPIYLQGRVPDLTMEEILKLHMDYQLSIWRDHLKLFPEVGETLAALKAKGAKLAVVTSRRIASTELYARGLGIWPYFDFYITPESTPRHKPDPAPAHEALRLLGVPASRALFIGDAVFDMQCGGGAGCDTCYVSWGYLPPNEVTPKPTWVLDRFSDLLRVP